MAEITGKNVDTLERLMDIDLNNDTLLVLDASETNLINKLKRIDAQVILAKSGFPTAINDIGTQSAEGFGVGICPASLLPAYMVPLSGTFTIGNDNYGNYKCLTDESIMVWVPKFYFKYNSDNTLYVLGTKLFANETDANASGFALHRSFVDGGSIKDGFFVDKYNWSLTSYIYNTTGIASSIKNGNPISSAATTLRDASNNYAGSFSNCKSNGQSPANIYGGAWAAAKSRGNDFAVMSIFISEALALLSLAHGQTATSTAYCAWYDATGAKNYPKGNNNYTADIDDATVTFTNCDDGYWSGQNAARKNGSGSNFAKTTHNGQNCGVSDINGNQYNIVQGFTTNNVVVKNITAITRAVQAVFTIATHGYTTGQQVMITGTSTTEWNNLIQNQFFTVEIIDVNTFKLKLNYNASYVNSSALTLDYTGSGFTATTGDFYVLKESVALKNVTGGNSLTTSDHFNPTFITANFDKITPTFRDGTFGQRYGNSTNQVIGFSTDRTSATYKLAAAGMVKDYNSINTSGTNKFGIDYFYQYIVSELCPLRFGYWNDTANAGVWYVHWNSYRTGSHGSVSARACLYV
ncbi:MAG: hypothetical protein ACYC5G_05155 [Candidatus Doudnabacteria bacterium]